MKAIFSKLFSRRFFPLALMLPFAGFALLAFAGQGMLAHAEDAVPGLGVSVIALLNAIKDKAVASVLVMYVFQILRSNEAIGVLGKLGLSGGGLRVAVAVLTTLGYVANSWAQSGNIGQAAIEGLFVSGGAMLIYDAIKAGQTATVENHVSLLALKGKRAPQTKS